jgi:hypothetical protein
MSGMQGNQGRPAIRVVLREDASKELSFLTVRGDRPSVPLAAGKFWFAVATSKEALIGWSDAESRLTFPVERFCWHEAYALIAAETNDAASAKVHAQSALEAAALDHSGFRCHPTVGLVTEAYDDIVRKLKKCSVRQW